MEYIKISLPIAYMIETLRHNGVSNQELIEQIEKKDVSPWKVFNSNFDFNELVNLSKKDDFTSIIQDGYTIKFVTIRGLQNLLRLKFDLLQERDYDLTENGIAGLTMDQQQFATLKQMLSPNCIIHKNSSDTEGKTSINIELA
ncbi:hypothetical protein [Pseudogracilibacillus auburnensis]|uniref:hypothetical protein n=1 Tax=Pseudogracilibacillus auburnensis TaxID=1494959 RepID=UPI001A957C16|nr:hypothetical protein [Pseudogracilibacillus auburnensis]MBO1005786.1 hypothetical protein [Pseudogracilibacillus auburnensis]